MDEKECRKVLSTNIKLHRNRLHLSQLDLASMLNISPNFLSDIETGKKWVSPLTLTRLAKALHVEVYELFKPEKDLPDDVTAVLSHCLDDISVAVKKTVTQSVAQIFMQSVTQTASQFITQSLTQSVRDSVQGSLNNIRKQYINEETE
jgi:transcriptional regulator with XRE-family HTH domain